MPLASMNSLDKISFPTPPNSDENRETFVFTVSGDYEEPGPKEKGMWSQKGVWPQNGAGTQRVSTHIYEDPELL